MLGLDQHRRFTPTAVHPAIGVLRIPIIDVVTPLAHKVSLGRVHLAAWSQQHGEVFRAVGTIIARRGAVGIREFFGHRLCGFLGEIGRVVGLVEHRLPEKERGVVTINTHDLANIIIHPRSKQRILIPKLPAGRVGQNKQAQFITGIHKGRVRWGVPGADDDHAGIAQFFGVAPVHAVGHCVAHNREILVPISTDHGRRVRFSI